MNNTYILAKRLLLSTLLAAAFAPAFADDLAQADDAERRIVIRQGTISLPPGQQAALRAGDSTSLTGAMLRISTTGIVKNAPYSAEAVSESLQQLVDGNQIVHKSSALQYRDSAGRTRTEVRGDDGALRTVTINDPVEGSRWILNPERKTASRSDITSERARMEAEQARKAAAQARAEAARTRIEQLRQEGKLPEGTHIIIKDVQRGDAPREVRVRIAQPATAAMPAARAMSAQIAPMIIGAANDGKWAAKAVTRELGTRDMQGVKAEGSQRSYAIPAGEIGNRDPIEVSSETWYSPELQITVFHKRTDPRSGDIVYRLEGLKRAEPPAALFSVPADYTVRGAVKVATTGNRAQ